MAWNYRLCEHADGTWDIREVHYDAEGKPASVSAEPVRLVADSAEQLRADLMRINVESKRRPVFRVPEGW